MGNKRVLEHAAVQHEHVLQGRFFLESWKAKACLIFGGT